MASRPYWVELSAVSSVPQLPHFSVAVMRAGLPDFGQVTSSLLVMVCLRGSPPVAIPSASISTVSPRS